MLPVLNSTSALEMPNLMGKYLLPIQLRAELGLAAGSQVTLGEVLLRNRLHICC